MKKIPDDFEEYRGIQETVYWLDRMSARQQLQSNREICQARDFLWKFYRAIEFDLDKDIGYFFPENFENGM